MTAGAVPVEYQATTPLMSPFRQKVLLGVYLVGSGAISALFLAAYGFMDSFGWDARAYWGVNLADPYAGLYGEFGFFPYSPAIALLAAPFGLIPWPLFLVAWTGFLLAVMRWMAGNWQLFALLLFFFPVVYEVAQGNIQLLLAAAMVIGFRYPAAWAFVLLTKVTPGIGLLWFAVRREWRSLAVALGTTGIIVAASFAIVPHQWFDWIALLGRGEGELNIPLWPRLLASIPLIIWGALTNRRWTMIIVGMLAAPNFSLGAMAMVAALPLLSQMDDSSASQMRQPETRTGSQGR